MSAIHTIRAKGVEGLSALQTGTVRTVRPVLIRTFVSIPVLMAAEVTLFVWHRLIALTVDVFPDILEIHTERDVLPLDSANQIHAILRLNV